MEYNREHIDDLFKKELGGYTEAPPPAVWDALEKRLDEKDNRRLYPWLWFIFISVIGASLGILFAGGGTTQKVATENVKQHTAAPAKQEAINQRQEVVALPITKNNSSEVASHPAANQQQKKHYETAFKEPAHNQDNNISTDETNNDNETNSSIANQTNNAVIASSNNGMLVNTVTKKGNILVEQTVIKDQEATHKDNSSALLADNTAGPNDMVIGKKHGIVVQSLPDETPKDTYIAKSHYTAAPEAQPQQAVAMQQPTAQPATPEIKKQKKYIQPQAALATTTVANKKTITHIQIKNSIHKKENTAPIAAATKKLMKSIGAPAIGASMPQAAKHKTGHNTKRDSNHFVAAKTKPAAPAKQARKEITVAINEKKKAGTKKIATADNSDSKIAQATAIKKTINKEERAANTQQPSQPGAAIAKNNMPQPVQTTAAQQQPVSVLNSAAQPTTAAPKNATPNKGVVTIKKDDTKLTTTFKDPTNPNAGIVADISVKGNGGAAADTAAAKKFRKFEFGIKAGYEGGFSNDAARKLVASPYVEYKINSRLSVMTQPAFKSAQVGNRPLSGSQSFYSVNPGGITKLDSTQVILVIAPPGNVVDTFIKRNYTYSQSYDSIAKTYKYGGSYIEFEVPLLVKYGLTKSLSVYGGAIITYSKLINITEQTYTGAPVTVVGSGFTFAPLNQAAPTPPPYYNGTPISGYKGPLYPSGGDLLRLGYMLGLSYEFNKRFLLDVSLEQSGVSPNIQGGYDINKPLSVLYYRFTIGYRLGK